jgi:hypothetical protein
VFVRRTALATGVDAPGGEGEMFVLNVAEELVQRGGRHRVVWETLILNRAQVGCRWALLEVDILP